MSNFGAEAALVRVSACGGPVASAGRSAEGFSDEEVPVVEDLDDAEADAADDADTAPPRPPPPPPAPSALAVVDGSEFDGEAAVGLATADPSASLEASCCCCCCCFSRSRSLRRSSLRLAMTASSSSMPPEAFSGSLLLSDSSELLECR